MNEMAKWIERKFPEKPALDTFPMLVERLAGTPARIHEKVSLIPADLLTRRTGDSWTMLEHIGHLADLEPLWLKRLEEFREGVHELTAADMSNRKTYDAGHNHRPVEDVARSFVSGRIPILELLESLENGTLAQTSLHPRLRQPMRLIDLCLFVAEHDDHHLARISALWRVFSGRPGVFSPAPSTD